MTDRGKRVNAGNKMARLLNEEEEDEFYVNAYGGFAEEVNDDDYLSESSHGDSTDSDFSNSSAEGTDAELLSDGSNADGEKRKKILTKKPSTQQTSKPKKFENDIKKTLKEAKPKSTAPHAGPHKPTVFEAPKLRQRTVTATQASKRVNQENAVKKKAILAEIAQRKNVPEVRRLTQAELLAEAKITEEINKRSLAQYQRMEIEKKKARAVKTVLQGPRVRYHSFAVPSLADQPEAYAVKFEGDEKRDPEAIPAVLNPNAKASRVLISFSDDQAFHLSSLDSGPAKKRVKICPITGHKANYCDPLTNTPYANLAAFRVLRKLYQRHIATKTPGIELLRRYKTGELVL